MGKYAPAAPDCIHSRNGHAVKYIVIHQMEGTLRGTVSWFATPNHPGHTAAHYGIGLDGEIVQMVPDDKACWHAGNYVYNLESIGIEHEGWTDDGKAPPDAMLRASAKVTAILCRKFGIPVDRAHILGHVEVPGATHTDPGHEWDWSRYMELVRAA